MTGLQRRLFVISCFVANLAVVVLLFVTPTGEATSATRLALTTTPGDPASTTSTTSTVSAQPTDLAIVASTTAPEQARWTLTFGGDTLLTRPLTERNRTPFARIQPTIDTSDLTIVNLETALTTRGTRQVKTYTFRSPPGFANVLQQAGVDVVSLANNHTLDFGTVGLYDTLDALDRAGVARVGAGHTIVEALEPVIVDQGDTSIAILGASQIIPTPSWVAQPTRPGIASAGKHVLDSNTERVLRAVRQSRTRADVVIVVMHWGIEGDPCPSSVQRKLADALHDAGAAIVLGSHPHVLQPIEFKDSNLTAFSLGNFIWDPRSGATADTGILQIDFVGSAAVGYTFHPHRLDGNGWATRIDPVSGDGQRVTARTTRRCR